MNPRFFLVGLMVMLVSMSGAFAASVYLTDTPTINVNESLFLAANSTLARTGNCSAGYVVQNTTTNGVQCVLASTGSVTQVNTGTYLTGGPITSTGTVDINATSAAYWNGKAGAGASGVCTYGIANITDTTGGPAITCAAVQVGTLYSASTGLILSGTVFSLNTTYTGGLYDVLGAASVVNTTANIQVLGFNTTAQLGNVFYPKNSNPNGYYNASTLPSYPTPDNASWNQSYANTLYYPLTTNPNGYYNSTTFTNYYPLLTNPNGYYNSTTIPVYVPNTTAGVKVLGFNTTAEIAAADWANDSTSFLLQTDQRYNDTLAIQQVNGTANGKASPGTCPLGQVVQNTTTGGVQCIAASAYTAGTGLILLGTVFSLNTTYTGGLYDALGAASAVNTTANIRLLGFNTTAEIMAYDYANDTASWYPLANGTSLNSTLVAEITNRQNNDSEIRTSKAAAGTCPTGQVVQNATNSTVQCVTPTAAGDGTGGWTNNSQNTSTTLNVGIGSNFNGYPLSVVKSIAGNAMLALENTNTGGFSGVDLYRSDGVLMGGYGYGNSGTGGQYAGYYYIDGTNAPIAFDSGGAASPRGVLTTAGLWGFGTTAPATLVDINGTTTIRGILDMTNHQIKNVTDPTLPQDAATKSYVDAADAGKGISNLTTIASPNGSIVVQQNSTTANLSVNMTYVAAQTAVLLDNKLIESTNVTIGQYSTTSATTYTLIANLTQVLANASTYIIKCELMEDAVAATTGVQLQVNTTGTPTQVRTTYTKMASTSAMETFSGTSASSNAFAATGSSTTASVALLDSLVRTGASASTYTIEMRSEVAGSAANIESGSYCMAVRVVG